MLYIGIAGIFGALARFGISLIWNPVSPALFPWGTLICNLAGCFLLGYLAYTKGSLLPVKLQLPVTTGFIGSFTTFSTFSYETIAMVKHGYWLLAFLYVFVSLWAGLGLTWLGVRLAEGNGKGAMSS